MSTSSQHHDQHPVPATSPAATPPAAAIRKRRRWPWLLAGLLVIVAGMWWFIGGSGGEATEPADGASYVTEPAQTGDLDEEVQADATVAYADAAVTALRAPRSGTITAVHLAERGTPDDLEHVLDIDGDPVFALASDEPLYRDLTDGDSGADVEALENALDDAGYDPGDVDDEFDWETAEAVRDWRDDNDLERTGTIERSWFLWLPPGAAITDLPISPGDPVEAAGELATAADLGDLVVTIDVEQADIATIDDEQRVAIELDGSSNSIEGTVTDIPLEPGEAGTYPVTVAVDDIEDLRVGMQGTASVVVDVRRDAVIVPTGAVSTVDRTPTVDVLVDGTADTRHVELGLVTANGTEIVGGLSAGEQVILSETEQ